MDFVYEVLFDMLMGVGYWFKKSLNSIALAIIIICPYVSMAAAVSAYNSRGYFGIGGEWFVPVLFLIFALFLHKLSCKVNRGPNIPTPRKRFTHVEDDGEVNINVDRSEELILYMADLEDWLQRRKML